MTLPDEVKQAMKAAMREAWRGDMALEPLNEDEAGAYLDAALSALSSAGYGLASPDEMIVARYGLRDAGVWAANSALISLTASTRIKMMRGEPITAEERELCAAVDSLDGSLKDYSRAMLNAAENTTP